MDRFDMEEFIHSFEEDLQRSDRQLRPGSDGTMARSQIPLDQGSMFYAGSMPHGIPIQQQVKNEPINSLEELDLYDLLDPAAPEPFNAASMDRPAVPARDVNAPAAGAPLNGRVQQQQHHASHMGYANGNAPNLGLNTDLPSSYGYAPPNIRVDPVINVVEPDENPSNTHNYVDEAFPMYSASGVPLKGGQVPMFQNSMKDEFGGSYDSSPGASPHISVQRGYAGAPGFPQTSPQMSPLIPSDTIPPGTPHSIHSAESPLESPLASPMIGSPLSGFDASNDSSSHGFSNDVASPMIEESLQDPVPFEGFHRLDVPLRHSRALSDNWGDRERTAFLDTLAAQTQNTEGSMEFPKIQVHHASPTLGQPAQLGVPQTRHRSHSSPYEPTNDLKGGQMFACELCDKRFTRAYNLRSHMRTHTDERPFACKHCGKAFARQHDRKRHEALHSGEKRFVCCGEYTDMAWGCKKRFARADALGRHFRTEAGKACLRPLIDRIFTNGDKKESAPEGILFTGVIDGEPQVALTGPKDGSSQKHEREDHTRRTVIVTAVAEQLQGMLMSGPNQLPNDGGIPSGA